MGFSNWQFFGGFLCLIISSPVHTNQLYNPITHGLSDGRYIIIKVTGPPKKHVKFCLVGICFMWLNGYLGTFIKVIKYQRSNLTPSESNCALNQTWVFMTRPMSNRVKRTVEHFIIKKFKKQDQLKNKFTLLTSVNLCMR